MDNYTSTAAYGRIINPKEEGGAPYDCFYDSDCMPVEGSAADAWFPEHILCWRDQKEALDLHVQHKAAGKNMSKVSNSENV